MISDAFAVPFSFSPNVWTNSTVSPSWSFSLEHTRSAIFRAEGELHAKTGQKHEWVRGAQSDNNICIGKRLAKGVNEVTLGVGGAKTELERGSGAPHGLITSLPRTNPSPAHRAYIVFSPWL